MDPDWGHLTIKMSGHPPFGAQVILNGHEYVACQAQAAGIGFGKEGNCFTGITDAAGLARVADTLSLPAAVGRLSQVCDRWIYSACLCFGLDLDEQRTQRLQLQLLGLPGRIQPEPAVPVRGADGGRLRPDGGPDPVPAGRAHAAHPVRRKDPPAPRPGRRAARAGALIETPRYGLTLFKVHFGRLTLKAYTKGEHVLRFEAIVHNTDELRTGRVLAKFPDIITRLADMADRFATTLDCVDVTFLPDHTLDALPLPARLGRTRVGGVDLNKPRMRAVLAAVLALTPAPDGFTVADVTAKVHATGRPATGYTARQAAYDLRKLRGKNLIVKPGRAHRYQPHPRPPASSPPCSPSASTSSPPSSPESAPPQGRKPATWTRVDRPARFTLFGTARCAARVRGGAPTAGQRPVPGPCGAVR